MWAVQIRGVHVHVSLHTLSKRLQIDKWSHSGGGGGGGGGMLGEVSSAMLHYDAAQDDSSLARDTQRSFQEWD